ncbi:hypothetical protein H2Y56_07615 [Pectobacterium aroidearum]|uniref:Uncharacterized protein n=2 Tax=Pectobacterium TaxID=122277 RepID=A0ABR5ZBQ5_9GAMM|nr:MULTISPECIES: hypothetical protein [Pectobacterium]ACT14022.1 conserved hypothetical protein [Pectobacterium carotovorum subsp. carotovorum PC1]MBA5199185.1 hypothetical protein [Pectobacterium aroidearum]MBA5226336.1 hypothetical protein [Pectobacterium aroidearum]MBA5231977.1 hypothetical protein [Pectobacterium aroidearum]MBA5737141.1 hypothetical protein [Pectobacterium aroidearum]
MEILVTYSKEIFSILVVFLTWALNNYSKGKAKLAFGDLHEFTFLLNEPLYDENNNVVKEKQLVFTRSLFLVNDGRESATDISVVFNYEPKFMNIWPIHHYDEFIEKDNRYIIVFKNLSPKDSIRIELFSINNNLPDVLFVRSKECVANKVVIVPQRYVSPLLTRFFIFLSLMGIGASTYIIVVLLQWLVGKG